MTNRQAVGRRGRKACEAVCAAACCFVIEIYMCHCPSLLLSFSIKILSSCSPTSCLSTAPSFSMAASIYPDFPPQLTEEQSDYLLTSLKDWSIAHGLAVRPSPAFVSEEVDPSGVLATTAPITLFPSPFPRSCFEEARAIQVAYNELYAAIARDEEWLGAIVEE